ncbi:hypothetical protein PVK06_024102 [Gossypium arboreum]|uniref:Uncharacterized protein n=1 Tax=Gossypium arboreum TaxID=29729 RepID=A0ABR0PD61_GOSAR|nr:hypothetical protein PVK06_024102 [Gossypium arboreum]
MEETLAKPSRLMGTDSDKRASNSASGRPFKRGHDSHVSSRCARSETRLSQSKQQSSTVVESGGPARVYVVREPEDQDPIEVIIGTFTLQSTPLFSLVDSRSALLIS